MNRKGLKLAYITNETARKTTLKNRKRGLLKKISEISTLCDVKAGAIIYSPNDPEPDVWPCPEEFQSVFSQFREKNVVERNRKMMNQESYLSQRVTKEREHLKKLKKENRDREMELAMFQQLGGDEQLIHQMSMMELHELELAIDGKMQNIHMKLKDVLEKATSQDQVEAVSAAADGASSSGANAQTSDEEQGAANMNPDSTQLEEWLMVLMNIAGGDELQQPLIW